MRPGTWASAWSPERIGLAALALVAIVFGIHSAIDWTWFVPAVAVTGIFAAGWVAGRGPVPLESETPVEGSLDRAGRPRLPERSVLYRRLPVVAGITIAGILAIISTIQPWRADQRSEDSLELSTQGKIDSARAAANDSKEINSLSSEPYFDLAAIETAARNRSAALRALQLAVQREPANPTAWQRLGDYYLNQMNDPTRAIPVLRGAVYLDPFSTPAQQSLLLAIRAEAVQREARAARRELRKAARQGAGIPPGLLPQPRDLTAGSGDAAAEAARQATAP
jgi:hypothetical protein